MIDVREWLFNPEVYPLEHMDEGGQTFVDIPLVHQALRRGSLLKISLFKNFGSPLLGEPVVYPFALHAVFYTIFEPPVAALVARITLGFLTMIALTFFLQYYLSHFVASLCAFLVFSSPSFFYFFSNHPHQGALFYFSLILISYIRFNERPSFITSLVLYFAFLFYLLSVGINGMIVGLPFLFGFMIIARQKWKWVGIGIALFGGAAVAIHPHLVQFVKLAAASERLQQNMIKHIREPAHVLLMDLLWRYSHHDSVIHYSAPVIVLMILGLWVLYRHNGKNQFPTDRRVSVVLLGLLPLAIVLGLRVFANLAESLPVIKTMNIVRILWYADIFSVIAVGVGVENCVPLARNRQNKGWLVAVCVFLLFTVGFRLNYFRRFTFHHLVTQEDVQFYPFKFLKHIQPGHRLTTTFDAMPYMPDLRSGTHGILAARSGSLIWNRELKERLDYNQAISPSWRQLGYYFKPALPDQLAAYGIRYLISNPSQEDELHSLGWKKIDEHPKFHLFESPLPVSAVYREKPREFFNQYEISGNEIRITLPEGQSDYDLIATFFTWPEWQAFLDGEKAPIQRSENLFIKVHIDKAKKLVLRYEPFSDRYLITMFILSLGLAGFIAGYVGLGRSVLPRRKIHSGCKFSLSAAVSPLAKK